MSGRGGCGLPGTGEGGKRQNRPCGAQKCGLSFGKARDLVQKPAGPGPPTAAFGLELCRVDTQIGCIGVLGADTARFFRKKAVFAAVWVVKLALYAF